MKPLYIPTGKAKEYGDFAVNIYTGCPHRLEGKAGGYAVDGLDKVED